jgi:hypothetical protein
LPGGRLIKTFLKIDFRLVKRGNIEPIYTRSSERQLRFFRHVDQEPANAHRFHFPGHTRDLLLVAVRDFPLP